MSVRADATADALVDILKRLARLDAIVDQVQIGAEELDALPVGAVMFSRYQCRDCRSWISYSEANGEWRHE